MPQRAGRANLPDQVSKSVELLLRQVLARRAGCFVVLRHIACRFLLRITNSLGLRDIRLDVGSNAVGLCLLIGNTSRGLVAGRRFLNLGIDLVLSTPQGVLGSLHLALSLTVGFCLSVALHGRPY